MTIAPWFFGFIIGIVTLAGAQLASSWWMSRPHVPKWPKNYRRICACMDGHE